jgi:hypothetical protein
MTDQNESIQTDIDLKQAEEKKGKTIQSDHHLIKIVIVLLTCFLVFYLYQSFESYFTAKNNTAKDKSEQGQKKVNLGKEMIYELREVRVNQPPALSNDDQFQKKDGIPIFHKNTLKKLNPNQNSELKNDQERENVYEEENQE